MPDDPTEPSSAVNPPGPAPADPEAYDAWNRAAFDTWRRGELVAEAQRRWSDPASSTTDRALAGVWANPSGSPAGADLAPLLDDPELDAVLRARLAVLVALDLVGEDRQPAVDMAVEAANALVDREVTARTRLSVVSTAAEVVHQAGRPDAAMPMLDRLRGQILTDDAAPEWARVAVETQQLVMWAQSSEDHAAVVERARVVLGDASTLGTLPPVLDSIVAAAAILIGRGAPQGVAPKLQRLLEQSKGIDEAIGVRFQAQLELADIAGSAKGAEAAATEQRKAIEMVEHLGDGPLLAHGHRGLGVHLRAAERFREAAQEFSEASGVFERIDQPIDSLVVRLEQAATDLAGRSYADAESSALAVLSGIEDLTSSQRSMLEMQANQLLAQIAMAQDMPGQAADRWLRLADLAEDVGASPLEARIAAAKLLAKSGDLGASMKLFERCELDATSSDSPALTLAAVLGQRAEVLRGFEQHHQEAVDLARVAANHARTGGDERQAVWLTLLAGEILADAAEPAAAEPVLREVIETKGAEVAMRIKAHERLAEVLSALDRDDEAAAETEAAAALRPAN